VVWVESDSLSVVNTINRQQPYSGKADACLKQIRLLLKKFKKHKVSHSWRETNRAADYLAKMVVERDVVLWPADFPTSLKKIIKDDAEGMVYCRR
jgi:ribonuclease HI